MKDQSSLSSVKVQLQKLGARRMSIQDEVDTITNAMMARLKNEVADRLFAIGHIKAMEACRHEELIRLEIKQGEEK